MIFIQCPVRGEELIPERRIHSLTNTTNGIVLRLDCYCGHRHSVRTGRRALAAVS
ncbi:MAG: hypothetical protein ACR2KN_00665 [Geodermatophilaceae bacterium]